MCLRKQRCFAVLLLFLHIGSSNLMLGRVIAEDSDSVNGTLGAVNDIRALEVRPGRTKSEVSGYVLMGSKLVLKDTVYKVMYGAENLLFFQNASLSITNTTGPWETSDVSANNDDNRLHRRATKSSKKRRKKKRKHRRFRKPNTWRKSFFTLNERTPDPRQFLSKKLVALPSVPFPPRDSSALLCPVWPVDPRIIVNCSNGRRVRSRCAVRCAPGFRMAGEHRSNRRCRPAKRGRRGKLGRLSPQAHWSGRDENYKCVSACEVLIPPPNGTIKCTPSSGEPSTTLTSQSCQLVCDHGYDVINSDVRHCQSDGSWSGRTGLCRARIFHDRRTRHSFVRHQLLDCGDVHSVTTYTRHRVTYLVAGDTSAGRIRIYKWDNGSFLNEPWQSIEHPEPTSVVTLNQNGQLWLWAGNHEVIYLYRSNNDGRFVFSHTSKAINMTSESDSDHSDLNVIDLKEMNGQIYRCKGQNRPGRSIVVVQKLEPIPGGKEVYKRVMRRKMRDGEKVFQCSMFVTDNRIATIVTLNRPDGRGRIVIGRANRGRMEYMDVLNKRDLRKVSGSTSFEISGDQYIVVAQSAARGRCFVYKRLRTQPGD
ncbi:uncharacterized protein LOC100179199 [Ciona intestinalis]